MQRFGLLVLTFAALWTGYDILTDGGVFVYSRMIWFLFQQTRDGINFSTLS
ncbi:hypothetical protein [Schlesneria paludicola]|uniref:hypothetical protein n=1 Tax=Schlesneria paludicola TaxID=360056 RepID=UPI00031F63B6|nr:hypothetical protein [Schlesneria paludicola]